MHKIIAISLLNAEIENFATNYYLEPQFRRKVVTEELQILPAFLASSSNKASNHRYICSILVVLYCPSSLVSFGLLNDTKLLNTLTMTECQEYKC